MSHTAIHCNSENLSWNEKIDSDERAIPVNCSCGCSVGCISPQDSLSLNRGMLHKISSQVLVKVFRILHHETYLGSTYQFVQLFCIKIRLFYNSNKFSTVAVSETAVPKHSLVVAVNCVTVSGI
mmetsp:Transcript_39836/g.85898  ORF Transcript_39836/g.85898 Transcript_39836/m.85898 type:complete len:124 (+) Transcript_39836:519-890(+)